MLDYNFMTFRSFFLSGRYILDRRYNKTSNVIINSRGDRHGYRILCEM